MAFLHGDAQAPPCAIALHEDAWALSRAIAKKEPPMLEKLRKHGVVPVIAVDTPEDGLRLCEALLKSGLPPGAGS